MKSQHILLILIFFTYFNLLSIAQNDNGYKIDEPDYTYGTFLNVYSELMQRDFPVLVFTPSDYATKKHKWPVVYVLHGVNKQQANEKGLRNLINPGSRMQEMADQFKVIIVAPFVGITFYLDAPLKPEIKIASFVSKELTAFIDKNYNTKNNREGRVLCGFSMGGYGSVSLLCRYPDIFSVALAKAGVLNLATTVEDLYWDGILGKDITTYLGDYFENREQYHRNSCFNLINHVRNRKDIGIVLSVGKEDMLYKTNFKFHLWLNELKIPHIYTEYEGGHKWDANSMQCLLSNMQYYCNTQYLD